MINRFLLLFSFFICGKVFQFINAQVIQIHGEEWVNPPTQNDLSKPLVILDFWATWCGPCLQAMPETERLMQSYKDQVLLVYTTDEPKYTSEKMMNKRGYTFHNINDTQGLNIDNFQVKNLPTTVILNPDGKEVWRGFPTDLTTSLLDRLLRKYGNEKGNPNRFNITEKQEVSNEVFDAYKAKGIEIEFTPSESAESVIENLKPNFYFNGDLSALVSFLYNAPLKNIQNVSSKSQIYTLKCTYDDEQKFKKALEKFIKKQLDIRIDEDAEMTNTYVLKPSSYDTYFNSDMYDFSENKAKYLASDSDIQIDNATVAEMVQYLNQFSEHHFEVETDHEQVYDWNIHFKYNELTLEQLEHELLFSVQKEDRLVSRYSIEDL